MFETRDPQACWNGRLDNIGAEAKKGVYFYILSVRDLDITGWVELIR